MRLTGYCRYFVSSAGVTSELIMERFRSSHQICKHYSVKKKDVIEILDLIIFSCPISYTHIQSLLISVPVYKIMPSPLQETIR